ncbi:MAG: hypothetical protein WCC52_08720 [Nitrosotalea sp.]
MTKAILAPLRTFPDSSEAYTLDALLKLTKPFLEFDASSKYITRLVNTRKKLEQIRKRQPTNKPLRKDVRLFVSDLAQVLHHPETLTLYERNKLLTTRLSQLYRKRVSRQQIKYKLTDVILYILYSAHDKPVNGRIALTKQIFLTIKEILGEENTEKSKFIPYRYGPYSFLVTHVISNLKYDGFIKTSGNKNSLNEKFQITERGKKAIRKKFQLLPTSIKKELVDRRRGWDEAHTDGILAYVYERYPEFTEKSKIRNKYKSISWGRAKG